MKTKVFMRSRFFHPIVFFFLLNIYQSFSSALECREGFLQSSLFQSGGTVEQLIGPVERINRSGLFEIKKKGEEILERNLNQDETLALEKAHRGGLGEEGKDGTLAGIDNYTEAQLKEKAIILKQAGFSKEERKKLMEAGVVGWKFWRKTKMRPPTDIVDELNEEGTKVHSIISTYRFGMIDYGSKYDLISNYDFNDFFEEGRRNMKKIGDSYYWTQYVPRRPKYNEKVPLDEGQFIVGFAIYVNDGGYEGRYGWWFHHIHWKSRARDKQLNQETIREIFQEIYEGKPEEVITDFQTQYLIADQMKEQENQFIYPFILDPEKKQQVKQIIQRVLNRRGT